MPVSETSQLPKIKKLLFRPRNVYANNLKEGVYCFARGRFLHFGLKGWRLRRILAVFAEICGPGRLRRGGCSLSLLRQ